MTREKSTVLSFFVKKVYNYSKIDAFTYKNIAIFIYANMSNESKAKIFFIQALKPKKRKKNHTNIQDKIRAQFKPFSKLITP